MKKILLLVTVLFLAFSLNAQDFTQSIGKNASNVTFTGRTQDTITDTDTWSYVWQMSAKNALYGYNLYVSLDSVSGTPADAAVLAGSQDNSTYTTISTISWAGTTSDTILIFNDVSTGVLFRYLRLAITGTGTQKAKVNQIYGKIGGL